MAADAVEVAVRQHAQKSGLKIKWHVPDLVEEQGAVLGLLEAAAPHGLGAGEGAALVAEQLRFQQVLRDRRGVQGDEGLLRAWAVLVQRARHELLAGARFARDQHGHVRLRQAADGAEHLLHRRRMAQDLGRLGGQRLDAGFAQALFESAPDQRHRLVDVEWLGQVIEGAALERGHRRIQVREGGDDDDRQAGMAGLDGLQQVDAGFARHADVRYQHLRGIGFEGGQGLARVGEAAGLQAFARQGFFEHPANRCVVVDNPDWFHVFVLPATWIQ